MTSRWLVASRALRLAPLALGVAVAACQAGSPSAPTTGPSVSSIAPVTFEPGLTPSPPPATDPIAEPTEHPPEIPIFEDAEFLAASTAACTAARPEKVYGQDWPTEPPGKVSGYDWFHIVVLELRGEDGTVGPPPLLPPESAYYPDPGSLVTFPGGTGLSGYEAPISAWVEVLACVALREGASRTYSGDREVRVTGLDAIVWLVDHATGELVMEPWLVEAGLPTFVNADLLLWHEGRRYFPADVRTPITYALGKAVPNEGAYHGGEDTAAVAEYDKPVDLPPGTRLLPGHTFVLRLVVLPGSTSVIDFVDLLCAPVGRIVGAPLRVATAVSHDLGLFTAASSDVSIEGEFSTETVASGEIRRLSATATECGVPRSARWVVGLAARVQASGDGYELIVP